MLESGDATQNGLVELIIKGFDEVRAVTGLAVQKSVSVHVSVSRTPSNKLSVKQDSSEAINTSNTFL